MNKYTILTVLAAALLCVPGAYAQDDAVKFNFDIRAGWFIFQDEPLSDSVENNWSVGGDIIAWFGDFGIGAGIEYLTKSEDDVLIDGVNVEIEYTQIPLNVNAYYMLPFEGEETSVYITGGFSAVLTDITSSAIVLGIPLSLSTDEMAYGFNGGVGIQFGMFFVEGRYLWAEADFDFAGITLADDVNVGGFSGWVGVRF